MCVCQKVGAPEAGAEAMGTMGVGLGGSNQRAWDACGGVRSLKC